MSFKTVKDGYVWGSPLRVAREVKFFFGYSFIVFPALFLVVLFNFSFIVPSPDTFVKSYDESWYYTFSLVWLVFYWGNFVFGLFLLGNSLVRWKGFSKRPSIVNSWSRLSLVLFVLCLMVTTVGNGIVKSHAEAVAESSLNSWLHESYGLSSVADPNSVFELPVKSGVAEFKNVSGRTVFAEVVVQNGVITLDNVTLVGG